jgi:hypothetical protein
MRRFLIAVLTVAALAAAARTALGFCGFYVAKADTKLFNQASQVVLVRDGDRTVLTMANDFKGDPKEFAIVIPVPTFLQKEQIHVAEKALLDHLDAYSAPRLVEYFDGDPCQPVYPMSVQAPAMESGVVGGSPRSASRALAQARSAAGPDGRAKRCRRGWSSRTPVHR